MIRKRPLNFDGPAQNCEGKVCLEAHVECQKHWWKTPMHLSLSQHILVLFSLLKKKKHIFVFAFNNSIVQTRSVYVKSLPFTNNNNKK